MSDLPKADIQTNPERYIIELVKGTIDENKLLKEENKLLQLENLQLRNQINALKEGGLS